MNRRSDVIKGWVNFPVHDSRWKNSNEGGMIVKLVVINHQNTTDGFEVCSGAWVRDIMTESLIGDDRRPLPEFPKDMEDAPADILVPKILEHDIAMQEWESYHFPNLHYEGDISLSMPERYLSRPYLASIVIGNTGWSGLSNDTTEYWHCRFDDLTEEGRALYRQMERLYPGCDIHLLTFLDT